MGGAGPGRAAPAGLPEPWVRVEAVPVARYRSGFSRDFEDLVAFLATKIDKTTISRISRVGWDSVGGICERVVAEGLDPGRLDGCVSIGVDEVSWRRHHRYLTLVSDHPGKKIVWGAEGKDTATLDAFFDELGSERAAQLEAVSMDIGAAFNKSVRAEGPRLAGTDLYRSVPRGGPGHDRTGRGAPGDLERTGTNCVNCSTRRPPRRSKAPAGRCSSGPRTSPRNRPPRCARCVAAAATSGAPTP